MIIAFYTPSLRVGGYEKVVVNYANTLSLDNDVYILCGTTEGQLRKNISARVRLIDLNCRARSFIISITRWINKNRRVDLLYVPFRMFSAMSIVAKAITRTSVCVYGVQHGFEGELNSLTKLLYRAILPKVDVLAAVSKTVAHEEASILGISPERYYILDNPVLTSCYSSIIPRRVYSRQTVIVSGRLAKDKHVEIPIEIVRRANLSLDCQLVVLGDGPEMSRLKQIVHEYGLDNRVIFEGYVENPLKYMSGASVYMITSEIESFGNGVIEAMYAGLPTITTDCGGPVELIEKNKYGICIGRYDSPDVIEVGVKALERILSGAVIFSGMEAKAQHYTSENLETQFFEPYIEYRKKNI